MSNRANSMNKGLSVKDLVTTGIFTALVFVFILIGGMFFATNPVLTGVFADDRKGPETLEPFYHGRCDWYSLVCDWDALGFCAGLSAYGDRR